MPIPPPHNNLHIVKDGEWVASIADEYGYTEWEKEVWNHSNNSELKKLREDAHVLNEGDELFIPPFQAKTEKCQTGQKHTFELNTPTEILRLQFNDPSGEPIKNVDYFLTINRRSGRPFKQKNTKTDGEGRIEEGIPSDSIEGNIRIPDAAIDSQLDFGYLWPMKIGDAGSSVRGAAQRLHGLGDLPKEHIPPGNELTPEMIATLREFARKEKLKIKADAETPAASDVLTEEMIKKIKEKFGT
jgi:hypothetical protein